MDEKSSIDLESDVKAIVGSRLIDAPRELVARLDAYVATMAS